MVKVPSERVLNPAENLLPPAPRLVRYRSWGAIGSLWARRLFILPHTLVGVMLIYKLLLSILLAVAGANSQGHIVRTWTDSGTKGRTNYHIAYTDGTFSNKSRTVGVPEAFYNALPLAEIRAGTAQPPITVRVLELGVIDTATPIIDQFLPGGLELKWFFFAMFWNGILSFFIFHVYIGPFLQRRVYRSGVETSGQIVAKNISRGKSTSYRVTCNFRSTDGRSRYAKKQVSRKMCDGIDIGQAARVLYLPHAPKRAAIYGIGNYVILGPTGEPIRSRNIKDSRSDE